MQTALNQHANMLELSTKSELAVGCPVCSVNTVSAAWMLTGVETVLSHASGWQHCAVLSFPDGELEVKGGIKLCDRVSVASIVVGILWMQTAACCFLSLQRPVVQVGPPSRELSNLTALP